MTQAPRVLLHNDATARHADRLRSAFPQCDVVECTTYENLPDMIREFRPDVVFTIRFAGSQGFPRDALLAPGGPRWIANGGVGTDHFGQWDPTSTTITNAAGVAADMMAEYVLGGFLHFTLDIEGLRQDKAGRVWRTRNMVPLKGMTLLIVGLGHTGRALAKKAKVFGMHVVGLRSWPQPTECVDIVGEPDNLPEFLEDADCIAVCAPLTPATRGMLGRTEIAAMAPGVLLADVSRGGILDQTALAEALASGHVAGAALDVFETEPLPTDSPLWGINNLIISPHCSSVYDGWEDASFDLFLDNLDRWIAGSPLRNVVDPERGY